MSDSHAALIAELALARQQTARLREALGRILQDASGGWHDNSRARFSEIIAFASEALAGEEAPLRLRVTRRTDDWHACIDGEPGLWACGSSHTDALGDLLIGHRERFGVAEIIVDDWRNREPANATEESEPGPFDGPPLLCGARDKARTCTRPVGHEAGHSDGRRNW